MGATTRTFLYTFPSTMAVASILIVILTVCWPEAHGLPYIDSDSYDQLYQNKLLSKLDEAEKQDDIDNLYEKPSYPFADLARMIDAGDNLDADNDETYDFIKNPQNNDKLVGARAKRLGFSYFPFRYTHQFMLNQQRPKPLPELVQAADPFPLTEDYLPVKRRLAFTALRGR